MDITRHYPYGLVWLVFLCVIISTGSGQTGLSISGITDNSGSGIGKYQKFEISFQVNNSVAGNFQLPYDPNPPNGINPSLNPRQKGISVDAQFTAPGGATYNQPAFYYYTYQDGGVKSGWNGNHKWIYPTGQATWKVRFSPNNVGTWQYRLVATDVSGTTQSDLRTFTVADSNGKGFIRVSPTDPRYFEFDNGEPFNPYGTHFGDSTFATLAQNGLILSRNWWSAYYGQSWPEWLGNRNQYDGYLPRSGYIPINVDNNPVATIRIDYEGAGDTGWFDACRLQDWNRKPEAVKQNTIYLFKITYYGEGISGPRNLASPNYGLVGKITTNWLGDRNDNCYDSTSSYTNVTNYGHNTTGWGTIQGNWNSGDNNFLPRIYVALENVISTDNPKATASILSISLREDLGNGQYGPEIIEQSSAESELYFSDKPLYDLDQTLNEAEQAGMYLKVVLLDKNDHIYKKINDDGSFVIAGDDNEDGVYGCDPGNSSLCLNQARTLNKTRWLQEAYYRYLQARFGYSTHIHSWEFTNEGDPGSLAHWQTTDELGKTMSCRVFGVPVNRTDSQKCTLDHPNAHLVTTSFWHSFPGYDSQTGYGIWGNPKYPNIGYADGHAYITTSPASATEKALMEKDSAFYHLWHSQQWGGWKLPYPVVRGEAGMTPANTSTDDSTGLGIQRDIDGVWFHNYVWAGLDSGALYEIYWYYNDHIIKSGSYDHRPIHKKYQDFLANIPLANGHYVNAAPTVSNTNLRVVGQKDTVNKRAHLWIQNINHTWKNVVDNVAIAQQTGTIIIAGFPASTPLRVEWWNTYSGVIWSTENITTNSSGTLTISVSNLTDDVAIKVGDYDTPSFPTPTATPGITGDLNHDWVANCSNTLLLEGSRRAAK